MKKEETKQLPPTKRKKAATVKKNNKPRKAAKPRAKSKKGKIHSLSPRELNALAVVIAVVFMGLFYFFFIRPYAYRWKPCYGLKGYGVCMPFSYAVHGTDISHYQGEIQWNKLREAQQGKFPLNFIFMKATEGGDFSDKRFRANFDSAKVHGFIRGAYHFYNPKTDPIRQADFFIRTARLQSGDLPPVLDIEVKARNKERLRSDLKIWLDRVEKYYKVKPILYTSYKFKMKYLNDSTFNSYPYWIAHYYVDSVRYQGEWKFWQHTDVGTLPGVEERADMNVFNGSLPELKRMLIP